LTVQSDLGQHVILPAKIKMIRFLKPANEPQADGGGPHGPVGGGNPPGPPVPGMGPIVPRVVNPNTRFPTARAKVILHSGEEIIGEIQGVNFTLEVDYGTMTPAMDKLRAMTFSEPEKKADATVEARGSSSAQPQYIRFGPALLIRSPSGDRVRLYTIPTRQALELSGPEGARLEVTPVYGQGIMALSLRGPRITRLALADSATGWQVQDLLQPAEGRLTPVVAQGIALYRSGRHAYAYAAEAHRWDVVELPEGLPDMPAIGPGTFTIEGRGQIFTFSAQTGQWGHIDLRAVLEVGRAEEK
jgi:hypothetical protein